MSRETLFTARLELPWKNLFESGKISALSRRRCSIKLLRLPGVQSAGIGSNWPLMGGWQTGFWREEKETTAAFGYVEPPISKSSPAIIFKPSRSRCYAAALFNEQDTKDSQRVIIIDQAMAEQYFPGEDPIGKRLGVSAGNDDEGWVMSEIVGVTARMRFHAID